MQILKDIPVKDYIELIAVTEANEDGETHYALDDYIILESATNQEKEQKNLALEIEKEIVFEKKVVEKSLLDEP